MRALIVVGWLLVPVGFGIWHHGPGQERMQLDAVAKLLAAADGCVSDQEWAEAIEYYDEALKKLPADRVAEARRIRLERAKVQMKGQMLAGAYGALKALCEELQADEMASPKVLAETRSALAQAHYYVAWLMRLEGEPREVWEPEIEAARQNYRLLAEQAQKSGDEKEAKKNAEDLEAAVRLARMDLSELQGLPLPSQCCGSCSGKCKGAGKRPGKNLGKGGGDKPKPREKDARGASSGPPPDTGGH
jgi:hypothetical protein